MRPTWASNKGEDFDLRVKEEDDGHETDTRLARRWKRRYNGNQSFKPKICSNAAKITSVENEDKPVDKDYRVYLTSFDGDLGDNSNADDDDDGGVALWSVDDGHDNVIIEEKDDQVAGPQHKRCVDEDDYVDPQYKMFLENLREDGKSYVLEVMVNNEISVHIKYEKEEGLCDGLKMDTPEISKSCWRRENIENTRTLRSASKSEKTEGPNIFRNVSSIERTEKTEAGRSLRSASKRVKTEGLNILRNVSSIGRTEKTEAGRSLRSAPKRVKTEGPNILWNVLSIERTKAGRSLRSAPKRVKTEGPNILWNVSSIGRTAKTEAGRSLRSAPKRVKTEGLNILWNFSSIGRTAKAEAGRSLRSASHRKMTESPNILNNVSSTDKTEKPTTLRNVSMREGRGEALETLRDVMGKESKSSVGKVEQTEPISAGSNARLNIRPSTPSTEALRSAGYEWNCGVESNMNDECYQTFLNCLKSDGESLVYTPGSRAPLKYYEDKESSSDSEIVAMDKDPFHDGNHTPFIVDEDCNRSHESPSSSCSQFRERLMENLKRPYDENQHVDLLHEVSLRKSMEGNRELRGGTKSYPLESLSASYIDLHCDFARKLSAVSHDPRRSLNLLRGFIFWLQNVAHEGSFRPWKDSSCLRVLPQW